MSALPQPVTVADHYLAAIHDRLGEIRDRLPALAGQPAEGEPVELREPAPPAAPAQPLTEPARPAPKPPARKPAARAGTSRTRTRKGTS
ncbi:hypothetical protein [Actinomadura bangladeshensis]|uniref:Uncharacterized protein n=1 Tax=Actinomadura bangladeshensis TaxID=453573 RepID=A0A6L9QBY9_9ACTN|nr:hypothetical protein [Actinomadura bangladeshensis]NEA22578.1 hypothetical protein [Actinomadura bangladeshensis]